MQVVTQNQNTSSAQIPKPEPVSVQPAPPVAPVVRQDPALEQARATVRLAQEKAPPPEPEKRENKSENYRLNFDREKRQIYLELLNPVTGDVIQRVPRDDLAFEFAASEGASETGVNFTI